MEHATRMPTALAEKLRAVDLLADSLPPVWLRGGQTNRLWKIISPAGTARVAKLVSHLHENPLFPNDPSVEAAVMQQLSPMGLSPRFDRVIALNDATCLLYDFVEGETWQNNTPLVAELLGRIHAIDKMGVSKRAADGSREMWCQTKAILAKCSSQRVNLNALKPQTDVAPSGLRQFLHGDCVPGNLLVTATGLMPIDWQCPAMGDPCQDIAFFLSPAMQLVYRGAPLAPAQIAAFWDAYPDPTVAPRYRQLAPWFHLRMAAYCMWKTEQGANVYRAAIQAELDQLSQRV